MLSSLWQLLLFCTAVLPQPSVVTSEDIHSDAVVDKFFARNQHRHSNNWAVLVCTSRFWFNYRHIANTLSFYRTVKRLGIPDSHIILMLADDVACNARNKFPGTVYNNADRKIDLYGGMADGSVEVDYRGYEVTVEAFIRVLTGRHEAHTPKSKRLMSDDRSNVLVYLTGHGGDEFLKFQDAEEISSHDLADAFHQMQEQRRYNEILFIIDTCQANTLYTQFYSRDILATGSSRKGQNSYSHHQSQDLGVAVIDRFTYFLLEFMEQNVKSVSSQAKFKTLMDSLNPQWLLSDHGVRTDLFQSRHYEQVLITDFFGNVQAFELTLESYEAEKSPVHPVDASQYYPSQAVDHSRTQLPQPTATSEKDALELIVRDLEWTVWYLKKSSRELINMLHSFLDSRSPVIDVQVVKEPTTSHTDPFILGAFALLLLPGVLASFL